MAVGPDIRPITPVVVNQVPGEEIVPCVEEGDSGEEIGEHLVAQERASLGWPQIDPHAQVRIDQVSLEEVAVGVVHIKSLTAVAIGMIESRAVIGGVLQHQTVVGVLIKEVVGVGIPAGVVCVDTHVPVADGAARNGGLGRCPLHRDAIARIRSAQIGKFAMGQYEAGRMLGQTPDICAVPPGHSHDGPGGTHQGVARQVRDTDRSGPIVDIGEIGINR